MNRGLPIAVTMGEPAGIGGDITLKAWAKRQDASLPDFFVIDDAERLASLADRLGLAVPITVIESPGDTSEVFGDALPVVHRQLSQAASPGVLDVAHAGAVIASIEQAVSWTEDGSALAVVTNPIQKSTLYDAGFQHPGHTEFLAELCQRNGPSEKPPRPLMMLSIASLRVVPVTGHVPLAMVSAMLNTALITQVGEILNQALKADLGIANPRISVTGFNPHAGEDGALGREEIEIIAPAVEELRRLGIDASGPYPADTLFHSEARAHFDAALCMYHDQALIPLKALDFDHGVNTTLGLSIVRTSPDHGTALDLAGTGRATPASFIEALHQAHFIAERRLEKI